MNKKNNHNIYLAVLLLITISRAAYQDISPINYILREFQLILMN